MFNEKARFLHLYLCLYFRIHQNHIDERYCWQISICQWRKILALLAKNDFALLAKEDRTSFSSKATGLHKNWANNGQKLLPSDDRFGGPTPDFSVDRCPLSHKQLSQLALVMCLLAAPPPIPTKRAGTERTGDWITSLTSLWQGNDCVDVCPANNQGNSYCIRGL